MKIASYLESLVPKINRRTIEKELQDLHHELSEHTLAYYDRAREMITTDRFDDDFLKHLQKEFSREIQGRYRGNFLEVTYQILANLDKHIQTLQRLIENQEGDEIVVGSMTYQRTQILRLSEIMYFTVRYARKLLIYTLTYEGQLLEQDQPIGRVELTRAQINWLRNNQMTFIASLNVFTRDEKKLRKVIEDIPDLQVNQERVSEHISTVGRDKLDPFNLTLSGFAPSLNPIYHIRMAYEDWQIQRYEAAKEDKRLLQYRILDLKNRQDGQQDPKVQQAIEYHQERVNKLDRKIAKLEERAYGTG